MHLDHAIANAAGIKNEQIAALPNNQVNPGVYVDETYLQGLLEQCPDGPLKIAVERDLKRSTPWLNQE